METFRAQLLWIQQQLSGLNASQKMLVASLLAIMVMTVLWWARYAGTADMEPVLDQSMSAADIGRIKAALDMRGINARVVGDRVLVPADRRLEAVAVLAYADALPSNSSSAWDEMIKQMSPWDSRSKTDSIQNHMKERMLSDVISGFFPGVARANVIINPISERRVGASLEPSASVQITTRGRDVNVKRLVDAAAATVASAVSGLTRSRVSVVVDGVPRRAQDPDPSGLGGADLYEQIEAQEKRLAEKITSVLMPGALVAVTVDLEITSSQETRETYDASKTVSKEKVVETSSEESSQPQQQVGEPGAISNMALSLAAAPLTPNATSTAEKSRIESEIFPSRTVETINKPAGKPTVVSAAVRIPRSYFVNKFRAANPSAKDPDDAALQPLVNAELPTIRRVVQNCVGMKSEESISVDTYFDGAAPLLAATEAGLPSGMGSLVGGHLREIAVGVLALISLFMISMMVRRSSPAPAITAHAEPIETPQLKASETVAGIASDGHTMLDGMELDEDAIKAQQMVEQVSTMVKEDPDAAASLIKRWLNRS